MKGCNDVQDDQNSKVALVVLLMGQIMFRASLVKPVASHKQEFCGNNKFMACAMAIEGMPESS